MEASSRSSGPLFKKSDKSLPSNYRPISLLSCVGKVFERVIYKHIHNYLLENKLFKFQSGFMESHSTIHQLIELYDNICSNANKRLNTCVVFCDISKAFDKVWHRGLIHKLEMYGIKGKVLQWLKDYLSSRSQRVPLYDSISKECYVNAGVPQGSV